MAGYALERLGDFDKALQFYTYSLNNKPSYTKARFSKANILYKQQNYKEAEVNLINIIDDEENIIPKFIKYYLLSYYQSKQLSDIYQKIANNSELKDPESKKWDEIIFLWKDDLIPEDKFRYFLKFILFSDRNIKNIISKEKTFDSVFVKMKNINYKDSQFFLFDKKISYHEFVEKYVTIFMNTILEKKSKNDLCLLYDIIVRYKGLTEDIFIPYDFHLFKFNKFDS